MPPTSSCRPEEPTMTERPRTATAAPDARRMMLLDVRIAHRLGRSTRMGQRAVTRRSDLLGVFPQITGSELGGARFPFFRAAIHFGLAELDVERAAFRIERDDIAVAEERDRPADRRLGTDMADAEAARGAGKAAVGNQRDLGAHRSEEHTSELQSRRDLVCRL